MHTSAFINTLKVQLFKIFILLISFASFVSGCSSKPSIYVKGGPADLLPRLTSVITGPVGVLLTNKSDYSSDFTIKFQNGGGNPLTVSGQLLMRDGKLRLEAVFDKSMAAGDVGMIWNAGANQGNVFSEELQGYAPIDEAVRFTNLVIQVVNSPVERIRSHPIEKANLTFECNDGQRMSFQTFRAQDMDGLIMQISSLNTLPAFTMVVSNIRLEIPAEELFLPPDGFTRYANEAAMLNELGARQQGGLSGKPDQGGVNINYKPAGGDQSY